MPAPARCGKGRAQIGWPLDVSRQTACTGKHATSFSCQGDNSLLPFWFGVFLTNGRPPFPLICIACLRSGGQAERRGKEVAIAPARGCQKPLHLWRHGCVVSLPFVRVLKAKPRRRTSILWIEKRSTPASVGEPARVPWGSIGHVAHTGDL